MDYDEAYSFLNFARRPWYEAIADYTRAVCLDPDNAAYRNNRGRAFLEVSGGVREEDIPFLASLGVDRISLGSLTHSVRAADLALEVEPG